MAEASRSQAKDLRLAPAGVADDGLAAFIVKETGMADTFADKAEPVIPL